MTDICQYSFDPEERDGSTLEEEWSCPHETYVDTDFCIFHLPPETRGKLGVTAVDLRDQLLQKVNEGEDGVSGFVGAELQELELEGQRIGDPDQTLDLRHVVVDGKVDISGADVRSTLLFDDAEIQAFDAPDADVAEASFQRTSFEDSVNFDGAEVGDVNFARAKFDLDAVFSGARFTGDADFSRCSFSGVKTVFDEAVFEADVDFTRARFGEFKFTGASVHGNAVFTRASFKDDVNFEHAEIASADFSNAEFDGNSSFRGTKFKGSADFGDSAFRGWATFRETYFGADASFDSVWFKKDVNLVGESDDNSAVTLKGSRINGGTIETNSFKPVFYDLSGARIGPVKITPGDDENPFNYVSFAQTKFNGFDFDRHSEHLDDVDWEFHDTFVHGNELSDEVLEDSYRLAARDAKANEQKAAKKLSKKQGKYERRRLKSEGRSSQYVFSAVRSHAVKILVLLLVLAGAAAAAVVALDLV